MRTTPCANSGEIIEYVQEEGIYETLTKIKEIYWARSDDADYEPPYHSTNYLLYLLDQGEQTTPEKLKLTSDDAFRLSRKLRQQYTTAN